MKHVSLHVPTRRENFNSKANIDVLGSSRHKKTAESFRPSMEQLLSQDHARQRKASLGDSAIMRTASKQSAGSQTNINVLIAHKTWETKEVGLTTKREFDTRSLNSQPNSMHSRSQSQAEYKLNEERGRGSGFKFGFAANKYETQTKGD